MKHHALPRRIAVLLGLLVLLAFGCTVHATADTADRIQWNDCDSGGITLEASCTQNARIVFDQQVEGTGAFGFDSLSTNNNVDRTYAQYFFYFYPDALDNARPTIDISNCAYVTFDLYLSKSLVSGNIVDTNFNVSNQTDSWENGGRLCDASVLKNMTWQQGWNHVVIPIDWSKTSSTFNRTALRRGRYYMLYRGSFSDMTFMIDDVCFITAAGLEDDARRAQAKQLNVTIRELPAPKQITYAHAAKLRAANMAYDVLPEAYRSLVFEHPALVRANKAFDAVAAARVDDMIAALPNPVSAADQTAVTLARDAYDDLTDAQRQLVTGLSVLVNAEQRLAALQDSTPTQVDFAMQTLRAEAGQTVALNFTLAQANSGIGAMGWQFDYDNRYLRPIAGPDGTVITAGSAVQNAVFAANDERLLVQLATADGLSASGTLLTLYFQVVQTPPANTTAAVTATLLNGPLHAADPVLGPVCHVYQVQVQSGGVAGPDTTQADKAAAKAVDDMILALPANITLQDEAAVTAARAAYNALTAVQKEYVTQLPVLTAAEQALAEAGQAAADRAAAQAVDAQIAALPATVTLQDEPAVTAARAAYNALTVTQKEYVTQLPVLTAAESQLADLQAQQQADLAAARAVDAQIAALPSPITLADREAVAAARSAYSQLTKNQRALVQNLATLTAAENALVALEQQQNADVAAALAVDQTILALPDHILLEDAAQVSDARRAYNALTAAQKALVTQLPRLQAAEQGLEDAIAAAQQEAADRQAARPVNTLIAALPTSVTLDDADQIYEARQAYNALTESQKQYVARLPKLVAAEQALDAAIAAAQQEAADRQAAKPVNDLIAALPADITVNDADRIHAARQAYDALTPGQKRFVTRLAKLAAAEKALAEAQQAATDQAAAQEVDAQIAALPATVTVQDEAAITAARSAYDGLTAAQKEYVANLAKLEAAEQALAEAQQAATDQAAAQVVDAQIAALPTAVTVQDEAAITAARSAYDGLTTAQKGYVTKLAKLEAAEQALIAAKQAVAQQAADKAAAQEVDAQIAALPATVTVQDEAAIAAARSAYDGLTAAQKGYVTHLAKLEAAEQALAEAQQAAIDQAAAQGVDAQIAALPATVTVQDEAAITAARSAYDGLTAAQKGYVTNLAKLEAAEQALAQAQQAAIDQAAAQEVDAQIAALPATVTVQDEAAITAARSAYDGLTTAQKGYVTDLAKLEAAEQALIVAQQAATDQAAAKEVDDHIAALPATVTVQDEAAITAARSAYDGLTTAQKGYVTNLAKLEAAEQALAALQAQPEPLPGDVNEDGVVDARDALLALKAAVGKESLSARQVKLADLNTDGAVDARDALLILKIAVGKPI